MKLITLNVAGYKNWELRQPSIINFIESQNSDVVFFQEVKFEPRLSPLSQAAYINSLLTVPYEYTISDITKFYSPSSGIPFREGLAVLSRFPALHTETIVLTKAEDDKHTRIAQLIDLRAGEDVIKIANVHFSNNRHSVNQLKELLAILDARGETRYIAGDFNILDVADVRSLTDDKYILSYDYRKYVSFPSENLTLDHILLPKLVKLREISVVDDLSDHSAITCEI